MRVVIAVVLLIVAMASSAPNSEKGEKPLYDIGEAPELFAKFMRDYNREYKDEEDKRVHYEAFKANLVKINELNAKNTSATYGINKFADYTEEENKQMFGRGVIIQKKD